MCRWKHNSLERVPLLLSMMRIGMYKRKVSQRKVNLSRVMKTIKKNQIYTVQFITRVEMSIVVMGAKDVAISSRNVYVIIIRVQLRTNLLQMIQ